MAATLEEGSEFVMAHGFGGSDEELGMLETDAGILGFELELPKKPMAVRSEDALKPNNTFGARLLPEELCATTCWKELMTIGECLSCFFFSIFPPPLPLSAVLPLPHPAVPHPADFPFGLGTP